ncbi:hypothetical protein MK543_06605 [Streptococcus gallolyticus subsp. gallolyticus]|uniref:hypothetical protein n=1 Tax=Streptococcus gallolyticus TaxID=315405 RepID=UPI00228532FC|nr:hypothetical protein [Streptococcus gallolyticus]MCY7174403.1 hypothetical protein [Streptococcus gallolyticus subsp. gallolyticus]MCY7176523.1 hypothetical protein [Streptococcus gallolyticus subsp. gallolyticus]MCY7180976.1 hypothetical protein [Streptococcus gallolyticus subsp. gallolyticus]MCY7198529.1 hypothetical protein [Streptococcus gallolyticus subsp. gallolyticus]MCY7203475.1 hypothetical protein [Streptococcus gallolyticus subsp. gallolyticus]
MAILIAGNVEVLKESDLLKMFPEEKVIVLGKVSESKHRIRSIDWKNQTDIGRLLTVYHVTSILYFSKSVEPSKDLDGELLQIRKILNALTEDFFVEFLYVTGSDLRFETENSRGVMLSAYEQLLRRYSQQQHFSLKILQSLYLYQLSNSTDDLRSILTSDKDITLHPDQKAYYIFGRDLLDLCRRIFDNWTNTFERIEVPDSFGITFQQLFEELNIYGATFSEEAPLSVLKPQTSNLRKDYGWFPKVSLLEDLSTRDLPTSAKEQKTLSLADRLRKLAKLDKTSVKVIVLIVLFILGEMLSHLLSNQMYFKTVDYRLFAIVISGLSLGMFYGIWAAVFASIGLIIQNILAGETNLQTLFFEPANWIPYIIYLVSGLVSGYVKEKDQADLFRILAENEHLEQQLSDEESFVEDLETPYLEIFMVKLLDYISNIFDTDEIAIYEVRDNQTSKLQLTTAQNTTHLMLTAEQLSKVSQQLVNNTVWVNQHLRDDYPMYLAGIFANGDLRYYLSLDHLPTDKLNLYHQNLLKSLMGLASLSYRRLYQKTTSNVQHEILEEKVFCQKLLALRAVDSPYFVGQVLHLGVVAEEIPKTTLTSLQEELSLFDSLGQVESQLCLLINTYTQSLTDWHEKLSDLSFDVADERNIEETIESIAFRQMMS